MTRKSATERIKHRKKNAVDPEAFLFDVGAVETVDTEEQLELTDELGNLIAEHLEDVQDDPDKIGGLAQIFGVDDEDVTDKGREYPAFKIIHTIRKWPSEGALLVDIATDRALRELTGRWDDVPPRQRYRLLQALRSFQDDCFFCGSEVAIKDKVVQSCCSDRGVITLRCTGCDRRLLEFSADPDGEKQAIMTAAEE